MLDHRPENEVRILFAYADREQRRQSGPALVLFGEPGSASAGLFLDHPCAEGRDGSHGPPARHVERLSCPTGDRRAQATPPAGIGWGY